jgi:hypothetical protein
MTQHEPTQACPASSAEADERIDALADLLGTSWRVMRPERLDQIAVAMGQREALLAIEKIPPERKTAALLARIASRTEEARDTVGSALVAAHAEIAVYVEYLRSQP